MKLIKQRYATDCAVACFAMITGVSYRKAMKLLHNINRFWWHKKVAIDATTNMAQVQEALAKLDIQSQWTNNRNFHTMPCRAIVIIEAGVETTPSCHAVVWNPQHRKILDPAGQDFITLQYCIDYFKGALLINE